MNKKLYNLNYYHHPNFLLTIQLILFHYKPSQNVYNIKKPTFSLNRSLKACLASSFDAHCFLLTDIGAGFSLFVSTSSTFSLASLSSSSSSVTSSSLEEPWFSLVKNLDKENSILYRKQYLLE